MAEVVKFPDSSTVAALEKLMCSDSEIDICLIFISFLYCTHFKVNIWSAAQVIFFLMTNPVMLLQITSSAEILYEVW